MSKNLEVLAERNLTDYESNEKAQIIGIVIVTLNYTLSISLSAHPLTAVRSRNAEIMESP